MLSVPLLIEKVVRGKVLPELSKVKLYEYPLMRRILNLIAGFKLKKTFGGRMRFFGVGGGAALSPDVEQFLSEARFPYAIGYGLTETAPLIAGGGPFRTKLRSTRSGPQRGIAPYRKP
jgi:long-chain acyl-CoA synthetase